MSHSFVAGLCILVHKWPSVIRNFICVFDQNNKEVLILVCQNEKLASLFSSWTVGSTKFFRKKLRKSFGIELDICPQRPFPLRSLFSISRCGYCSCTLMCDQQRFRDLRACALLTSWEQIWNYLQDERKPRWDQLATEHHASQNHIASLFLYVRENGTSQLFRQLIGIDRFQSQKQLDRCGEFANSEQISLRNICLIWIGHALSFPQV